MTPSEESSSPAYESRSPCRDDATPENGGDYGTVASTEYSDVGGNYEADVSDDDVAGHIAEVDGKATASTRRNSHSPPPRDDAATEEASVDVKAEPPELLSDIEGFNKEIDQELFARGVGPSWRKAQLKLPRRDRPKDYAVGETRCTKKALRELKRTFNVPGELKFVLPSKSDRADSPPPGHVTLYESFFFRCLLWFPIPAVLMRVLHDVNVSISQVVPRGMRHLVGILVRSYECGLEMTEDHFHHCLKWQNASGGKNHHYCITRGGKRIIHDFPNRDVNWDSYFFYVPVNKFSFESDCLDIVKSEWDSRGRL